MAQPAASPTGARRVLPAVISAATGVALSISLFVGARAFDQQRLQLEFDNLGDEIQTLVLSRIAANLEVLRSVSSFYDASAQVERDEFELFAARPLANYPGIAALAWTPRVNADEVGAHEAFAKANLKVFPGYHLWFPTTSPATSQPASENPHERFPLTFVEPYSSYGGLCGLDLGAFDPCRRAVDVAVGNASLVGTESIVLPGSAEQRFDSLIVFPVYKRGLPHATREQRQQNLMGMAVGMLSVRRLMDSAIQVINLRGQEIQLIDATNPQSTRLLYQSRTHVSRAAGADLTPWQREMNIAGRQWVVIGWPTEDYIGAQRRRGPWALLVGGLLFTALISAYVQTITGRAARVKAMVDVRTAELRESDERHRAVVEQSAEGIYLVDLESKRIIEANAALERLLGWTSGHATGKTVYELVDDAPQNVNERLERLASATSALRGEREYRRADGSRLEVETSATVISYGGRRVACTVVHDISARKRAQRELQEKHRQLEAALDELKRAQGQLVQSEKLASLGQMVAGVAHEINNPLSFVSNNVAVLQRDAASLVELLGLYSQADALLFQHEPRLAAQIRELAERIDLAYTTANVRELTDRSREGLRRIQQIVKDLRNFARLDQGDIHDADLNAGIESTLNIVTGLARKKGVTITKEFGAIPLLTCHLAKINQVMMNLLSNAIDACGEGGLVTVRTYSEDGATVGIEIRDNGCGIDPSIRERIFDPFFTTKPPGSGTGLGLSISYGIVQDHGGKIDVESTPGKGTTFTVRLPITKS